jgi:predicted Rossmann fold flavoprotein
MMVEENKPIIYKKIINTDIVIIGAGPSGLFTAINICQNKKVIIIEKQETAAKKLLIAGSGRCNITNKSSLNTFFNHYNDKKKFLQHQLKSFTNNDLIDFLKQNSMGIIVDKNEKVFPETEKSIDVLNILLNNLKSNNIKVNYKEDICRVDRVEDIFIVETENRVYKSKYLVIASGGKSYPTTGSTGDGYKYAKYFGHTIIKPKPALTPIKIQNYPFSNLAGVSIDDVKINLLRNNKVINSHSGDIGFTHSGVSGPGILDFSRYFESGDTLEINVIGINTVQFTNLFIESVKTNGKTNVKNLLKKFNLAESLIVEILKSINISQTEQIANINKESRANIAEAFCKFRFVIEKVGDFNVAMVTAGGISTDEIKPSSMESTLIPNLFFVGEVIDIDGDTGGYNLQFAFSSAHKAAKYISSKG